jgi:hypothetical protein
MGAEWTTSKRVRVESWAAESTLQRDETDAVAAYVASVLATFTTSLNDARFPDADRLLARFRRVSDDVLHGKESPKTLAAPHNEMCVAVAILREDVTGLSYEPALPRGEKRTIDFRALTATENSLWIDVKTIQPDDSDRWDQFERGRREGWVPPSVDLNAQWLGGEIWHGWATARARMLQHALELESKMMGAGLQPDRDAVTLMLCGDGFDWQHTEFEDFVAFYRLGRHRVGDPFAQMETHHINQKGVKFHRTISRFAYLERQRTSTQPSVCRWKVLPPSEP